MLLVAHLFVGVIFAVIGASFLITTGVLAWEFWDDGMWLDFMALDSHLFVFFPTFGLVALVAFYIPAVAFVDHYWKRVWAGKLRFFAGMIVLVVLSQFLSGTILRSANQSIWEIHPDTLATDAGRPARCLERDDVTCEIMPITAAVKSLRSLSQSRLGLSPFIRTCSDPGLIEAKPEDQPARFCPVITPFSTATRYTPGPTLHSDKVCCAAQDELVRTINALYENSEVNHSLTGKVHAALLPLKVFFLLVLLSISTLFLTLRFDAIQRHYRKHMMAIDIGLIVGTVSALFFPLMSQAFVQSLLVMTGANGRGPFSIMVPYMTVLFLIWSLMVIAFFLRREGSQAERFTKIGGFVGAGIGLLKYDVVVDYVIRLIGAGAEVLSLSGLVVLSVIMIWVTFKLWSWSIREAEGRYNGDVPAPAATQPTAGRSPPAS